MNKKKVVAIIQARMSSTRLPGKSLLKIKGKTVIERVVEQVSKASGVDLVVVATSENPLDDILARYLKEKKIECFRGDENDVLKRYHDCAKKYDADVVVRVCGDQPFADPLAIETCLPEIKKHDYVYCKHELGWPDGTGCEIVTCEALEKAQHKCTDSFEREHLQPYFLKRKKEFEIKIVDAPVEIQNANLRLAIDTFEDWERLNRYLEKKKKIVLIANFKNFLKESTNITTLSLAKELQRRGHEVTIVSNLGKEKKKYWVDGIKIYQQGFRGRRNIVNPLFIKHQLLSCRKIRTKLGKIDVIHHFSSSPLLALRALFAGKKNVKKIQTVKSRPSTKKGINFGYFLLNLFAVVTVPNYSLKLMLRKKGVKRVKVVRSHLDLNKFVPLPNTQDKHRLRKKYGYGQEKIILYYGALRKEKGIHDLVAALPEVIAKHKKVRLIICSRATTNNPEELRERIKKNLEIEKLGLANNVEIIITEVNVVDYLNLADLAVFVYRTLAGTEGNPSCVLEAMACQTPLISSDLPEIRELLENGVDALLAKVGDLHDLARNINLLLNDQKLQKKLTINAYAKVQEFDVQKIAEQFERIYEGRVDYGLYP